DFHVTGVQTCALPILTPCGPSSRASERVSPMTPAFATEYGVLEYVPPPRWADTDEIETIRPMPWRTIDSATRLVTWWTPSRLIRDRKSVGQGTGAGRA